MKRALLLAGLILLVVAGVTICSIRPAADAHESRCTVTRGPFAVVSTYEGEVESRRVESIMSRLNGPATIVELIPEGTAVRQGDVLVRFESAQMGEEVMRKEREFAVAECELINIERTKLPLEMRDLEYDVLESRTSYAMEQLYLDETGGLVDSGLVSKEEVDNQRLKVQKLEQRLQTSEMRLKLTREQLHPAMLKRARLELAATEQALSAASLQYSNCVIRAPIDGIVDYQPLWIDQEHRVVRVADRVHQNQPFMTIPDLSNLVVICSVPEAEFALAKTGGEAAVVPLAFPDTRVQATIETVTSIARVNPDRPAWQKSFRMVVAFAPGTVNLRPGMSVHVHVLSYSRENAILAPRAAVFWKLDTPFCKVVTPGGAVRNTDVRVGRGNTTHFEILAGLEPGQTLSLE
ncbi:MAG: efflux RND transporter periplasmic adaptor subunit [bacterium]